MKFDELDAAMRVFETAHDHCVLPGIHIVARLDGRAFTRLTKDVHHFEAPFDERFRNMMLATAEHLLECGPRLIYAYTQSDEISLLFHPDADDFGRKLRKLVSILAGEASAKFSLLLGGLAVFDCRICQLPTARHVVDYFRWRQEDAHRNCLNAHCYWRLRAEGASISGATSRVEGLSVAEKNELLFQRGLNFNDLPAWQRRGMGVHWEDFIKQGSDPRTGQATQAARRRLVRVLDLPMRDEYDAFVQGLLAGQPNAV